MISMWKRKERVGKGRGIGKGTIEWNGAKIQ